MIDRQQCFDEIDRVVRGDDEIRDLFREDQGADVEITYGDGMEVGPGETSVLVYPIYGVNRQNKTQACLHIAVSQGNLKDADSVKDLVASRVRVAKAIMWSRVNA